jgi:hypothetical protein
MSKPIIKYKKSFAEIKASLDSYIATTSVEMLMHKTEFIESGSILKAGNDQTKVLVDLERLAESVEHDIDISADPLSLHYVDNCKKISISIQDNLRILMLKGQEWHVTNISSKECYVMCSHFSHDHEQCMTVAKKLAPGESTVLHR